MLSIRAEQLDALRGVMLQQFEDRMALQLRRLFPDHPLAASQEAVRAFIREGIQKTKTSGITDEADVERFLIWMMPYGLEFEEHRDLPWVAPLLSNKDLTGTEKVNELENSQLFAGKA